jgi:hypothetical protein
MSLIALGRPLKILMPEYNKLLSHTWPEIPTEASVNHFLSDINVMIYTIWNKVISIISNK